MQSGTSIVPFGAMRSLVLVAAAAVSSSVFAAAVTMTPSADSEIREQNPEFYRGGPNFSPQTPMTELSVRMGGGNNNVALLRFNLAAAGITSAAQVQSGADLKLFARNAGFGGSNAGGVKIYGVLPAAPRAITWNEQAVMYRDAGTHQEANATNTALVTPSVLSQVSPGTGTAAGAPVPPIAPLTNTYGANPAHANAAPGLKFEYAPYSQNIVNLNQTIYNNNVTAHTNYVTADMADDGIQNNSPPNVAYASYANVQPGYNTATPPSGTASDATLTTANGLSADGTRIFALRTLNDVDPTLTSNLGYLDYSGVSGRLVGAEFSFANSLDAAMASYNAPNEAALRAFIIAALTAGAPEVSFLVVQKHANPDGDATTTDGDVLPIRNDNLVFASKEFDPANPTIPLASGVSPFAAQLIINVPEPTSLSLIGLAAGALLARRRHA